MGSEKDYWVACGELRAQHIQEEDSDPLTRYAEPRGVGCNSQVFWVTDNILHDWIQLPDVKPSHIVASRQIKKILTGNLNASV